MGVGFGLLALARPGPRGTPPPPLPATNQRLAIDNSYASNADSALAAALLASSTARTLPVFAAARTVAVRIEPCPDGGAVYFVEGTTPTARQSIDSSDGQNGSWSSLTVRRAINGGAGKAGLITIPPTATPSWIEIVTPGALSGIGFFHCTTDGRLPDCWIQAGASHTAEGMKPLAMRTRALTQFASRDPIFLNEGESAQLANNVRSNTVAAIARWPEAAGVICDSVIGNDVTAGIPYSGGQAGGLRSTLGNLYAAIAGADMHLIAGDCSYRRYPAVNEGATPDAGALPYNVNVMWPELDEVGLLDPTTGVARIGTYAVMLYYQQTLRDNGGDAVHPTQTGYNMIMDEVVRTGLAHFWTGNWPATSTAAHLIGRMETLALSAGASDLPTLYGYWVNAGYLARDLPASATRTALLARVAAQADWAYLAEAYRLVVVAETLATSGARDAASVWVAGIESSYSTEKAALEARIAAIEIDADVTVLVSFGTNSAAAPANNTGSVSATGQRIANLKDLDGNFTGISLHVTDAFNSTTSSGGATTGNNSGAFPDDCLTGYANLTSGNGGEIELRGLVSGASYRFEYISSRNTASGSSVCTVNGATPGGSGGTALPSLSSSNNTANTRVLDPVVPIDLGGGVIGIRLWFATGSANCPVNAFRLTREA